MGKLFKKSPSKAPGARLKHKQDKTGKDTVSNLETLSRASHRPIGSRLGLKRKKPATSASSTPVSPPEPPQLARRREHRTSSFKMGRTIGEKRERLETKNERISARKKDKKRQVLRVVFTVLGFLALAGVLVAIFVTYFQSGESVVSTNEPSSSSAPLTPTIPITDENPGTGNQISSKMTSFIATAEQDFRDLGFTPMRAVIPSGAIREVDFYLDGHPGYVKMTTDRDSALAVEDADRLYRYLANIGVTDFSYIDVRLDGKAYYKPISIPAE